MVQESGSVMVRNYARLRHPDQETGNTLGIFIFWGKGEAPARAKLKTQSTRRSPFAPVALAGPLQGSDSQLRVECIFRMMVRMMGKVRFGLHCHR